LLRNKDVWLRRLSGSRLRFLAPRGCHSRACTPAQPGRQGRRLPFPEAPTTTPFCTNWFLGGHARVPRRPPWPVPSALRPLRCGYAAQPDTGTPRTGLAPDRCLSSQEPCPPLDWQSGAAGQPAQGQAGAGVPVSGWAAYPQRRGRNALGTGPGGRLGTLAGAPKSPFMQPEVVVGASGKGRCRPWRPAWVGSRAREWHPRGARKRSLDRERRRSCTFSWRAPGASATAWCPARTLPWRR
jgi:hypothetical protein